MNQPGPRGERKGERGSEGNAACCFAWRWVMILPSNVPGRRECLCCCHVVWMTRVLWSSYWGCERRGDRVALLW